jgi:hypothetical protein
VIEDAVVCDRAVVADLSDVSSEQSRPEVWERKHRVDGLPRHAWSVLPSVDMPGPAELAEVFGDELIQALPIEPCLFAPQFLFELAK